MVEAPGRAVGALSEAAGCAEGADWADAAAALAHRVRVVAFGLQLAAS